MLPSHYDQLLSKIDETNMNPQPMSVLQARDEGLENNSLKSPQPKPKSYNPGPNKHIYSRPHANIKQ